LIKNSLSVSGSIHKLPGIDCPEKKKIATDTVEIEGGFWTHEEGGGRSLLACEKELQQRTAMMRCDAMRKRERERKRESSPGVSSEEDSPLLLIF
jgi:hypothetical protein